MTPAGFEKHRNAFNGYCESLLGSKGKDYSENEDRLSNFKQVAERIGLKPIQVWAVYAQKHLVAIESFLKNGDLASESVRSRFADLRNYLDLGLALIEEKVLKWASGEPVDRLYVSPPIKSIAELKLFERRFKGLDKQWKKKIKGKWNLTGKEGRTKLRRSKK